MEAIAANILLEGLAVNALAQCETPVTLVTTDSREVCPGCIFVAFPGEKFDGHDFAAKALENGALCVVLNHPVEGVPEEKSVICPDSYHAMMVLGANYRSQFHPKVVEKQPDPAVNGCHLGHGVRLPEQGHGLYASVHL